MPAAVVVCHASSLPPAGNHLLIGQLPGNTMIAFCWFLLHDIGGAAKVLRVPLFSYFADYKSATFRILNLAFTPWPERVSPGDRFPIYFMDCSYVTRQRMKKHLASPFTSPQSLCLLFQGIFHGNAYCCDFNMPDAIETQISIKSLFGSLVPINLRYQMSFIFIITGIQF